MDDTATDHEGTPLLPSMPPGPRRFTREELRHEAVELAHIVVGDLSRDPDLWQSLPSAGRPHPDDVEVLRDVLRGLAEEVRRRS